MFIRTSDQTDPAVLAEELHKLSTNEDVKSVMILACDQNGYTPDQVDGFLKSFPKPLFGGVFPAIISGSQKLTQGFVLAGLKQSTDIQIIPRLSDQNADYEKLLKANDHCSANLNPRTMFVLVDGLSTRITALIDCLFNLFGLNLNYLGGGAGSLSLKQKPCLFTSQGLLEDCAVLASCQARSGLGVKHGWTTEIGGPYRVTESERNIVKTLNWRPAFEVYRQQVEPACGQTLTRENFFEIAKAYPFGISGLGNEKIVRDPLSVDENNQLTCVGEVPTESYLYILHGNKDSLIEAARTARDLAKSNLKAELNNSGLENEENMVTDRTMFFFDCISRVLYLEDDFERELYAVCKDDKSALPVIGALTIGEIANSGTEFLEFYNKTSVVAILDELLTE